MIIKPLGITRDYLGFTILKDSALHVPPVLWNSLRAVDTHFLQKIRRHKKPCGRQDARVMSCNQYKLAPAKDKLNTQEKNIYYIMTIRKFRCNTNLRKSQDCYLQKGLFSNWSFTKIQEAANIHSDTMEMGVDQHSWANPAPPSKLEPTFTDSFLSSAVCWPLASQIPSICSLMCRLALTTRQDCPCPDFSQLFPICFEDHLVRPCNDLG